VELTGKDGGAVKLDVESRIELTGEAALAVVQFHEEAADEIS
jgi:hypothetical protein